MVSINFNLIGSRIKQKRKELGLTQKDLAAKVNLSEGSVSKYEHGKVEDATSSKLNEFAAALGVSAAWLLGMKLSPEDGHVLVDMTVQERKLLEMYRTLSEEGKAFLHNAFSTAAVMYPAHQ